ncbi:hypothetical protein F5Y18DRAFT_434656 [Xylariaceae sp. FL1019]|nr:hypothetical protein F5Y18DRAFT_434656 [Xylariaceae sp. FL1019]
MAYANPTGLDNTAKPKAGPRTGLRKPWKDASEISTHANPANPRGSSCVDPGGIKKGDQNTKSELACERTISRIFRRSQDPVHGPSFPSNATSTSTRRSSWAESSQSEPATSCCALSGQRNWMTVPHEPAQSTLRLTGERKTSKMKDKDNRIKDQRRSTQSPYDASRYAARLVECCLAGDTSTPDRAPKKPTGKRQKGATACDVGID